MATKRKRKAKGGVVDLAASAELAKAEDTRLAAEAWQKADAWAKSDPGTPYGVLEPVRAGR